MNKLELVERAAWEAVTSKPENQVIIEPNWVQQTTPHAPTAFLNGVYKCEIADDSIISRVQDTIAHYKKLKLPFRWKITPKSQPAHLKSLLIENGMVLKDNLFGLIAMPGQLQIAENPEVRVESLSRENLEDWLTVQAKAWNVPPPGIAHLKRTTLEAFEVAEPRYFNYLAYYKGQPAASAAFGVFPGYAFLIGGAVNPEVRGNGVYRTLLAHRLKIIAEKNLPAVVHCLETTSAPICLKLGFEKVCEIQSFELP